MPTWPSPRSERLGTPKVPAIGFTRGMSFEASRFAYAAACQVACPPATDRTGLPAPEGFYFQASGSLVARPVAGYDYNMDWTPCVGFHPLEWQLASVHQILAVTQAEREPGVEPDRLLNDLGREAIPAVAGPLHPPGLTRDRQPRKP